MSIWWIHELEASTRDQEKALQWWELTFIAYLSCYNIFHFTDISSSISANSFDMWSFRNTGNESIKSNSDDEEEDEAFLSCSDDDSDEYFTPPQSPILIDSDDEEKNVFEESLDKFEDQKEFCLFIKGWVDCYMKIWMSINLINSLPTLAKSQPNLTTMCSTPSAMISSSTSWNIRLYSDGIRPWKSSKPKSCAAIPRFICVYLRQSSSLCRSSSHCLAYNSFSVQLQLILSEWRNCQNLFFYSPLHSHP